MSASTLPREDLALPSRPVRRTRLLIIGETSANRHESDKQAREMRVDEVMRLDVDSAPVLLEQVRRTPPDRLLVLGPLWVRGDVDGWRETYAGAQARRYLRGAFPVRWSPGRGVAVDLTTMPEMPRTMRLPAKAST